MVRCLAGSSPGQTRAPSIPARSVKPPSTSAGRLADCAHSASLARHLASRVYGRTSISEHINFRAAMPFRGIGTSSIGISSPTMLSYLRQMDTVSDTRRSHCATYSPSRHAPTSRCTMRSTSINSRAGHRRSLLQHRPPPLRRSESHGNDGPSLQPCRHLPLRHRCASTPLFRCADDSDVLTTAMRSLRCVTSGSASASAAGWQPRQHHRCRR